MKFVEGLAARYARARYPREGSIDFVGSCLVDMRVVAAQIGTSWPSLAEMEYIELVVGLRYMVADMLKKVFGSRNCRYFEMNRK